MSFKRVLIPVLLLALPSGIQAQQLAPGQLLVASPMLAGTDFAETVLLVIYHEDDSSIAIALNRPTWVDAAETFDDVEPLADYADTLYFGGPVGANQLLIVFEHDGAAPERARRVFDGVYVTPELDLLERYGAGNPDSRVRLFAGHAAWAPGRLEEEVESGAWRTLRATRDLVFAGNPETLWETVPLVSGDVTASR